MNSVLFSEEMDPTYSGDEFLKNVEFAVTKLVLFLSTITLPVFMPNVELYTNTLQ